jgi:small nuclear ribonucleoprotein (snRNP)-like protein
MSMSPKMSDEEIRTAVGQGGLIPFVVETLGGECFSGVVQRFDPAMDTVTFDDMNRRDGSTHTHLIREIRRVDRMQVGAPASPPAPHPPIEQFHPGLQPRGLRDIPRGPGTGRP